MKQTAVEWLVEKLMKGEFINSPDELIEQAKQMEKEQILDAFNQGMNNSVDYFIPTDDTSEAEQYYNETYKKN